MIKLICIKDCDAFNVGDKCWAIDEGITVYDRYDVYEYYILYIQYDCELGNPMGEKISKDFFATHAEWREMQMDSILN